jgi:hypothetical protein
LDVDGVLNPEDSTRYGFNMHHLTVDGVTWPVALNPAHGPMLMDLAARTGAELAWGTTWEYHANDLVAEHVGLPNDLPWAPMTPRPRWGRGSGASTGMWKAQNVVAFAAGRPFVWFDDEPDAAASVDQLARTEAVGQHLVVRVRPWRGLGPEHLAKAEQWLTALNAEPVDSA